MSISFRQARKYDLPAVKDLIADHWRRDHPFIANQGLLDFQHRSNDGSYHFSIAEDKTCGDLLGMCGWISYAKWDHDLRENNSVWYTNWFVVPDTKGAVGLKLQEAIANYEVTDFWGTIGLRPNTLPLYKARRFHIGVLNSSTLSIVASGEGALRFLSFDELHVLTCPHDFLPYKTPTLFAHKYIANPFRAYVCVDVSVGAEHPGIAVLRRTNVSGAESYLLIDYCGSGKALSQLPSTLRRFPLRGQQATITLTLNEGAMPQVWLPASTGVQRTLYAIRSNSDAPILVCAGDGDYDRIPG